MLSEREHFRVDSVQTEKLSPFAFQNKGSEVQRQDIILLNDNLIRGVRGTGLTGPACSCTATSCLGLLSTTGCSGPGIIQCGFYALVKGSLHHSWALLASRLLVFQAPNPEDLWKVTQSPWWKCVQDKIFLKALLGVVKKDNIDTPPICSPFIKREFIGWTVLLDLQLPNRFSNQDSVSTA